MISSSKPISTQSNFIFKIPGKNLEENNEVFTVKKIIHEFLDKYDFLLENEKRKVGRHKTYKTDELLGIFVLGVLNEKTTYRKLQKWINNNDEACNYILNNKRPSISTMGRFFTNNKLLIYLLFEFTIHKGIELNLIGFEYVTIDGTILKANTSRKRLIKIEELNYLEKLIENFYKTENRENILFKMQKYYFGDLLDEANEYLINEIENNLNKEAVNLLKKLIFSPEEKNAALELIQILKDNYDGKHTISVTDPECRWMKDKKDNMGLNYNYQAAIDGKNDFIVGQRLVNNPTDHHQLIPMIETVKMNLSRHPIYYLADNGFLTTNAVEYLFKHNIKAILPDRTESTKLKDKDSSNDFHKTKFKYNWVEDIYICPNNKILKYQNNRKINKVLYRVYSTNDCKTCNCLKKCTKGSKREIFKLAHPLRIKMNENYHSDFGRELYKKRAHTGESYFGTLKEARNFSGIKRRGIKDAEIELTLQAIAHNIRIIHNNQ